ncbi:MAG TPA: hypothetical protein PLQ88_32530, partial [Blastocatellia bacterium]|nr:hypothetical protein [Blastocatellia bacterium]HMY76591.1 hypothetical protein [Blastocatellia bacterium]HNG33561.1 hypothetical protein [Blastocatellia bacterium]
MTTHPSPRSFGRVVRGSIRQVHLRLLLLLAAGALIAVYRTAWIPSFPAASAESSQAAVTVISAASYVAPVAPESIAVAFGTRLATQTVIAPA